MKLPSNETVTLETVVGGGQTLGTLSDGRKVFVWGGLPGETVEVRFTKQKSRLAEGVVEQVLTASPERVEPADPTSYLSTSPWQIMSSEAEQRYKAALIDEAFALHKVTLPNPTHVFTDNVLFHYRNKVEFSWYGSSSQDRESGGEDFRSQILDLRESQDTLDLAFFRRGTKGKILVDGTSLAREEINILARQIRDLLQSKSISARQLKTLLIRSDQQGNCVWQLYVKNEKFNAITNKDALTLTAQGGEVIFSDPRSPASKITKRLVSYGDVVLEDTLLGVPFRYACEGFFQVNLPVYVQALKDIAKASHELRDTRHEDNNPNNQPQIIDLYSGVGTIGLTVGGDNTTLVEINSDAVREMKQNINRLKSQAKAVLAPSEKALEYITSDATVIVDPPRAGLHSDVTSRLLEVLPPRIIYLSCNPVTQARDVSLLLEKYRISAQQGYNFFPRTPHIEHLVVLEILTPNLESTTTLKEVVEDHEVRSDTLEKFQRATV